jgi:hypothetical protein
MLMLHLSRSIAGVAQLLNIAASRNRAVFDFGRLFALLLSGVEVFPQKSNMTTVKNSVNIILHLAHTYALMLAFTLFKTRYYYTIRFGQHRVVVRSLARDLPIKAFIQKASILPDAFCMNTVVPLFITLP